MWEDRLQELLAFRREFGHLNVPQDWHVNPQLGRWVVNLRRQIRTGALWPDRLRRLADEGIRWTSADERRRHGDREWDRRCNALSAFQREHGHSEVPVDWPEDPGLAAWAARQRHLFRSGALRDDRRRRLQDAGIDWPRERGRSRARDGEWDRMFERLAAWQREHGHCRIPKDGSEDPKLVRWVARQRHYFRTRSLREDRLARLEELGLDRRAVPDAAIPLPGPREQAWQRLFESLSVFRKTHGHCNVPRRWAWNPKLARWVHHQRDLRRRGSLSRERQLRLDALGFEWFGRAASLRLSR